MRILIVAALAALSYAAPLRAEQILGPGRIDNSNRVILPGGPTLGRWQGGKYQATPDALTLPQTADPSSGGDVSPFSVKPDGATVSRALRTRFNDTIQAVDRGVVCNGTTDIGSAMQALFNSLRTGGPSRINMPTGKCLWNTATTLTKAVILDGQGSSQLGDGQGTLLVQTNTAITPITVTGAGGVQSANGIVFSNIGVQQVQPALVANWLPTNYPPFFAVIGAPSTAFRNIVAWGVDKFVSSDGSGRLNTDNVVAQCFTYCVKTERSYDADRHNRFHVWPVWSTSVGATSANQAAVIDYQNANSDAFVIGRSDTPLYDSVFVLGMRDAMRFVAGSNSSGSASKILIGSLGCDQVTHCIHVVDATGLTIQADKIFAQGANSGGTVAISTADAIRVESGGQAIIQAGVLQSELADGKVINLLSTSASSKVQLTSLFVRLIAGGAGQSVINAQNSSDPHEVSIANPPILAPTTATLPIVNAGSNAILKVPFLNYQLIQAALAGFQGGTFAANSSQPNLILSPTSAGTITSLNITLPSAAHDGQETSIMSTQPVSGLSLTSGYPIVGNVRSLAANVTVRFKMMSGTWVRIQ